MQDIEKEVILVISQVIENLCPLQNEKLLCLKTKETERNFPLTSNGIQKVLLNFSFRDILQSSVILGVFQGFENPYSECVSENEVSLKRFHSVFPEIDSNGDVTSEKFNQPTSNGSLHYKPNQYLKLCDGSGDNKCDDFHIKRADNFKDVFVQTIFRTPATIDSHCQCDLLSADGSTFTFIQDPEKKKKMKLDTHSYSYITYGKANWEFQSSEMSETGSDELLEKKTTCSDNHKPIAISKSTSRIRLGLSKRIKRNVSFSTYT